MDSNPTTNDSARYPFTRYPNGWFAIARSTELAPGTVRALRCMGQEVVVLRTEQGEVRMFDAWCVHLGARLGYGGTIEGDKLVCPFHGWKYGSDGVCVEVPYANSTPADARLRPWPVIERNGAIFAWHHHERAAPFYGLPEFPEASWTDAEWAEFDVEMHIFELGENGVDSAHFPTIHGCQRSEVELIDSQGIPFTYRLLTTYPGDGIGLPGQHVKVTTVWRCHGIGLFEGVHLADDFGMRVRQLFHFTPTDDTRVAVRLAIAVDKSTVPEELWDSVVQANIEIARTNFLEDSLFWKHKRYNPRPRVTEADGPISAQRNWARQFYPDM